MCFNFWTTTSNTDPFIYNLLRQIAVRRESVRVTQPNFIRPVRSASSGATNAAVLKPHGKLPWLHCGAMDCATAGRRSKEGKA